MAELKDYAPKPQRNDDDEEHTDEPETLPEEGWGGTMVGLLVMGVFLLPVSLSIFATFFDRFHIGATPGQNLFTLSILILTGIFFFGYCAYIIHVFKKMMGW